MSKVKEEVFPDYVIPRLTEASDPVFYCSTKFLKDYGLDTPQPYFLGWFDLNQGRGCHFKARLFLGEKWVLGRWLIEAPKDKFMETTNQAVETGLETIISREEFTQAYINWLAASHAKDVIEWWMED